MSWKTTDSAKRGGINDFIRAPIAINSDNITGVDSDITDLSLQTLLGAYNDGTFGNTVNILADSLAYSDINNVADPLRFYSTIKDANGKNVIMIGRTNSGAPDISSSMVFDDKENILFFADDISYAKFNGMTWGPARFLVNAPTLFTGDVVIDGSLDVQGDIHFHTEHEVSGNAYFSGEVIVRNNVGIGGNNVLSTTDTTMSDPVWPSPDAKLDIRSYTSIGRSDPSGDSVTNQKDWKAANIYLDCGNLSTTWPYGRLPNGPPPSGIEWRPLAIDSGPDICYNRLSAAIRFMPEDNYYRGGLGFYTDNNGVHDNQNTNGTYDISALRMKIDSEGDTTFYGSIVINNDSDQNIIKTTKEPRAADIHNSAIDLLYDLDSNTGKAIAVGYDTSYRQQTALWYHHFSNDRNSGSFNNVGYLGLYGHATAIAFGGNKSKTTDNSGIDQPGNVAIGYTYSDLGISGGSGTGTWSTDFSSATLYVKGDTYINGALEMEPDNTGSIIRTTKAPNDKAERSVDLLYNFAADTRKCIALGDDTSARRQSEFWYYHHDDSDTYNNFGYIGLYSHASTIAFGATNSTAAGSGNGGVVAIGYPESYMHTGSWANNFQDYTLSVKGNVRIEGDISYSGQIVHSDTHIMNTDLTVNGNVTANTFTATSDENKKEDIETISDATNKLASLRGVSFKLKDDEEKKTHYGVVAQELEKVFPDMVNGEEGDKSVAYMEIIGVLIETVKDLKQRIEVLEQSSNN